MAASEVDASSSGDGKSSDGSTTVILRAFLANLGIAIAKFIAAALTGSAAMLTEGIHSVVDTLNELFIWIGEKRSRKPPDELHPLGYARELYFWSFVVAVLIFALGAGLSVYEGVQAIRHPEPTRSPPIAFGVLAIALVLEGWSWQTAWKAFNKERGDSASVAEGIRDTKDTTSLVVLLEDSAAVGGVLLAAAGIGVELLTGNAVWDGIASVGIGLLLGIVAVVLLRETKDLLIGERARPELVEAIRRRVGELEEVVAVDEVITIHLGPDQIVAVIRANFANGLDVAALEQAVERARTAVQQGWPQVQRVFIQPSGGGASDPAAPGA